MRDDIHDGLLGGTLAWQIALSPFSGEKSHLQLLIDAPIRAIKQTKIKP